MATALTPEERTLRARLAAHTLHSTYNPRDTTAKARTAALMRFEEQVDPDGTLPEDERQRRARHALQAHMSRMAFESLKARRAKHAPKQEVDDGRSAA